RRLLLAGRGQQRRALRRRRLGRGPHRPRRERRAGARRRPVRGLGPGGAPLVRWLVLLLAACTVDTQVLVVPDAKVDEPIGCEEGCRASDLGCCANVCAAAEPRCPEPAPVGCKMLCDPGSNCGTCVAGACKCVEGAWECAPVCGQTAAGCSLP